MWHLLTHSLIHSLLLVLFFRSIQTTLFVFLLNSRVKLHFDIYQIFFLHFYLISLSLFGCCCCCRDDKHSIQFSSICGVSIEYDMKVNAYNRTIFFLKNYVHNMKSTPHRMNEMMKHTGQQQKMRSARLIFLSEIYAEWWWWWWWWYCCDTPLLFNYDEFPYIVIYIWIFIFIYYILTVCVTIAYYTILLIRSIRIDTIICVLLWLYRNSGCRYIYM